MHSIVREEPACKRHSKRLLYITRNGNGKAQYGKSRARAGFFSASARYGDGGVAAAAIRIGVCAVISSQRHSVADEFMREFGQAGRVQGAGLPEIAY